MKEGREHPHLWPSPAFHNSSCWSRSFSSFFQLWSHQSDQQSAILDKQWSQHITQPQSDCAHSRADLYLWEDVTLSVFAINLRDSDSMRTPPQVTGVQIVPWHKLGGGALSSYCWTWNAHFNCPPHPSPHWVSNTGTFLRRLLAYSTTTVTEEQVSPAWKQTFCSWVTPDDYRRVQASPSHAKTHKGQFPQYTDVWGHRKGLGGV